MMSTPDFIASIAVACVATLLPLGYWLRSWTRGAPRYERIDQQGGSPLLGKRVLEMGYWAIQPVSILLTRAGVSPNALSFTSCVVGLIAGGALGLGAWGLGGLAAALSGLLDALDGAVARQSRRTSLGGKVLDSSLDRYVEFFLLAGLLLYYRGHVWTQVLILAAILGSFMVSYSTALGEILGVVPPRGSMRRPERMIYLTLGVLLTPLSVAAFGNTSPVLAAVALIAVAANLSAAARFRWMVRRLNVENSGARQRSDRLAS